MPSLLLLFLLGFGVAATPSSGAVFTVGSDEDCDFPSLSVALSVALFAALLDGDSLDSWDEMRLARNTTHLGPFTIADHSVNLRGGRPGAQRTAVREFPRSPVLSMLRP